jgi:hypothetical protein
MLLAWGETALAAERPRRESKGQGKISRSTLLWNPTLAHKTRKNGAPIVVVISARSRGRTTRRPTVEIERLDRSGELLRHPKTKGQGRVPRSTLLWNPTLAHKTRKNGAPIVKSLTHVAVESHPNVAKPATLRMGHPTVRLLTACRKSTPISRAFRSRRCLLRSASPSFHREKPLPWCCLQFCLPFSTWLSSRASSPA